MVRWWGAALYPITAVKRRLWKVAVEAAIGGPMEGNATYGPLVGAHGRRRQRNRNSTSTVVSIEIGFPCS